MDCCPSLDHGRTRYFLSVGALAALTLRLQRGPVPLPGESPYDQLSGALPVLYTGASRVEHTTRWAVPGLSTASAQDPSRSRRSSSRCSWTSGGTRVPRDPVYSVRIDVLSTSYALAAMADIGLRRIAVSRKNGASDSQAIREIEVSTTPRR